MRTLALVALAGLAFAGCESTQSKSARLKAQAGTVKEEKGLDVVTAAKGIKVRSASVLSDANGTALVVELRNTTKATLAQVPIAITLKGAGGASVYKNNLAGLDSSLTSIPMLMPRSDEVWVDDQIAPSGPAKTASALAGAGGKPVTGKPPVLKVTRPTLEDDPTSGLAAHGRITNRSGVEQADLVVTVVGRAHGKVVCAGRAVIRRLRAHKSAPFTAFLIGSAKDAELSATARPSTLR